MPSSKFLVLSLVAALLLRDADASNCRVSGKYSLTDAPTMTAQNRHNHQHNHSNNHSNNHKHGHTVAKPVTKANPATVLSPTTIVNPTTTVNPATSAKPTTTTKPTTTADPVTTNAATLPTNILKNPGFDELDTDTGQYDGAPAWFQLIEGEVKAATKTLPAVSGSHFLHFNLVDEGLRGSIMQDVGGIDTSKRYTVSLWLKVTSEHGDYLDGSCSLDISLGYQTLDSYNLSTTYPAKSVKKGDGASWIQHSTSEFAIEDSSNLLFSIGSACGPNGRDVHVYFDNIVLQESHPATRGRR